MVEAASGDESQPFIAIKKIKKVIINLSSAGLDDQVLKNIKHTLSRFPGTSRAYIQIETVAHNRVVIETNIMVKATEELRDTLDKIIGHSCLAIQSVH